MITLECCGSRFVASEKLVGREFTCRTCGRLLVVQPADPAHASASSIHQPGAIAAADTPRPTATITHWARIAVAAILLSIACYPLFRDPDAATRSSTREPAATPARSSRSLRTALVETPASDVDRTRQRLLDAASARTGDPALEALFNELNAAYFGGTLPAVRVHWENGFSDVDAETGGPYQLKGLTDGRLILLRTDLQDDQPEIRRTLCHEMVHVKLLGGGDSHTDHGPRFQSELEQVFRLGCFEAIHATAAEKAQLTEWITRESSRLEQSRDELERTRADMQRESDDLNAAIADFNERVKAANARQSGWPGSEETEALQGRQNRTKERSDAFNAAIADLNRAASRLRAEVERYRLMQAYPHGVDDSEEP